MPIRGGVTYKQATSYKDAILEKDGRQCQECGCRVGETCGLHWATVRQLDVAHIVPWPEGSSTPDNQRVLCHPCNCRDRAGKLGVPIIEDGYILP